MGEIRQGESWRRAASAVRRSITSGIADEAMAARTDTEARMTSGVRATIEDLYRLPGGQKAELVNGEIVLMSPTGDFPGKAGGRIYASLDQYERATKSGYAYPDNVGFRVSLPHRESFSPDAAFYQGPRGGMRFLEGAPVLAIEVRSENDYGPEAERAIALKRADYFAAGTQVVWDVDLLNPDVIKSFHTSAPEQPKVFHRGEFADAEPALLGWRFPVDELFE
jgi:Uma2 family endonuclease